MAVWKRKRRRNLRLLANLIGQAEWLLASHFWKPQAGATHMSPTESMVPRMAAKLLLLHG